jgi:hypothetical protein
MVASQGGAIWLWIATRPFAWWPTLKLTLGPRVRIFLAAGAAAFVPSLGSKAEAAALEGVSHNSDKHQCWRLLNISVVQLCTHCIAVGCRVCL